MNAPKLTETQRKALGLIAGDYRCFGMDQRTLTRAAKELQQVGLVSTDGAFYGHNRSQYRWEITDAGRAALKEST